MIRIRNPRIRKRIRNDFAVTCAPRKMAELFSLVHSFLVANDQAKSAKALKKGCDSEVLSLSQPFCLPRAHLERISPVCQER